MIKEYKEIYEKKENMEFWFLQPLNVAAFLPTHAAKAAPTLNSLRPLGFRVLFTFFGEGWLGNGDWEGGFLREFGKPEKD